MNAYFIDNGPQIISLDNTGVNKKPSYRWGTARRGRASWNLV